MGSSRSASSVVSIIGAWRLLGSCASGTVSLASGFFGVHCFAPAGLLVSSHPVFKRVSRNPLSRLRGSVGPLRFRTQVIGRDSAMGLAERVAADDERHCLLVIHRHAAEGLPDVPGG